MIDVDMSEPDTKFVIADQLLAQTPREALRLMKEDTSNSEVMLHIVGGVQQISRDQVPNSAFNK